MAGIQIVQRPAFQPLPQLTVRPSPALVAATALLGLPSLELERAVERELDENPALERVEGAACAGCGRPLAGAGCRSCDRPRPLSAPPAGGAGGPDGTACEPTAAEALLREVGPLLGPGDRPVALYLLGSLDARGFLDTTVEEAAAALAVEPGRVAAVLGHLQAAGPAGAAARDLRECLLLQLDRCPDGGPAAALARRVVAEHLALLGRGQHGELARRLGVARADVLAARDFIRARLHPAPGLALGPATPALPLLPDIAVRERGRGFEVELVERERFRLVVSPAYEQAAAVPLPPHQREAVRRQLLAAREFIDRLERRWRTMASVAEVAVARQREFVRRGVRHLVPLTRAEVAASLGVHESTVSRAVAGRNVLLPSGRIIPFAGFFDRSGAPQDALAGLLASEERPRSDAELAEELGRLGFALARRTVAKYRERLGVLPSAQRQPAKPTSRARPA